MSWHNLCSQDPTPPLRTQVWTLLLTTPPVTTKTKSRGHQSTFTVVSWNSPAPRVSWPVFHLPRSRPLNVLLFLVFCLMRKKVLSGRTWEDTTQILCPSLTIDSIWLMSTTRSYTVPFSLYPVFLDFSLFLPSLRKMDWRVVHDVTKITESTTIQKRTGPKSMIEKNYTNVSSENWFFL